MRENESKNQTMQTRSKIKAKAIVEFWKNRTWLPTTGPVHVHQLDLIKLEELIEEALDEIPSTLEERQDVASLSR
jgi:hypothetical protein